MQGEELPLKECSVGDFLSINGQEWVVLKGSTQRQVLIGALKRTASLTAYRILWTSYANQEDTVTRTGTAILIFQKPAPLPCPACGEECTVYRTRMFCLRGVWGHEFYAQCSNGDCGFRGPNQKTELAATLMHNAITGKAKGA